jgi:ribose transport system permease protein
MLIMFYILTFTAIGQRALFIGQSREVARLSGFRVKPARFWAFVVAGFIAAVSGVISDGVLGSATPQNEGTLLLSVYAAAFLGFTTIQPGRFNAIGAGLSVFFLAIAVNGMNLLGAQTYVQSLFYGVFLVVAVVASREINRRRAASAAATST